MSEDVLITISGLQFPNEEDETPEAMEVVSPGVYHKKDGKHYVTYEEVMEGFTETTKNHIQVSENAVEVRKQGGSNVNMVFEKYKKNVSHYATPYGNLWIGIDTKCIDVREDERNIDVNVQYNLEINHQFLAACDISMNIKAKDSADFHLL